VNHFRRTEVFRNNRWEKIEFKQLKKGDNFRMFELNGEEVTDQSGQKLFSAKSETYYDVDLECWIVDIKENEY
jgi:hypothetical protein